MPCPHAAPRQGIDVGHCANQLSTKCCITNSSKTQCHTAIGISSLLLCLLVDQAARLLARLGLSPSCKLNPHVLHLPVLNWGLSQACPSHGKSTRGKAETCRVFYGLWLGSERCHLCSHAFDQSKSHEPAQSQGAGNILPPPVGGAIKSHGKGHEYREE